MILICAGSQRAFEFKPDQKSKSEIKPDLKSESDIGFQINIFFD